VLDRGDLQRCCPKSEQSIVHVVIDTDPFRLPGWRVCGAPQASFNSGRLLSDFARRHAQYMAE
jgi:hypothetical protein